MISTNTFNNHYVDLMYSGTDGVTNGTTTFTSASGAFTTATTGRTLVCDVCGTAGAPLITTVTFVNATTLTLATAATNTASSLKWQLYGYGHAFTGIELAGGTGDVVSSNTFLTENSGTGSAIEIDGSSNSQITGNNISGFGEAGGIGIVAYSFNPSQPIASMSQTGNIVTVTTSTATGCTSGQLCPLWQPGVTVALCNSSNVCAPGSSSYYGTFMILNQGYSRTGQTFQVVNLSGSNMATCSSTCGTVQNAIVNNNVTANTITMPFAALTTGNVYGLLDKTQGTSNVFNYGNTFRGNQINGTPVSGPSGFTACMGTSGSPSILDSLIFSQNTCNNVAFGFVRSFGTNISLVGNTFNNVTTQLSGTDNGSITGTTMPMAFVNLATCTATLEGNTAAVTDSTTNTNGATITGSGSNAVLGYCNGTNWVVASGTGSGGGTTNTIANGTATLGTTAISSATCATVVTVTATGVASTDSITWSPNASIKAVTGYAPSTSGGLSIAAYPTSGNVNFDVCNWSSGSITPGAVTLNWRVVR
jgi:hypothetical protein